MNKVAGLTKSERLRKAAKFCWMAGLFFTWQMLLPITDSIQEPAIQWMVAIIAAGGVQYVLSLIEGTILDGILPAPWQIDFRGHPQIAILAILAYGAFIVDVFVNFGGIYAATGKLDMTSTATAMHISPYMLTVLLFVIALFMSALFALGSELLEALADMYEGKTQNKPKFQYTAAAPQEHNRKQEPDAGGKGASQQIQAQRQRAQEEAALQAKLLKAEAIEAATPSPSADTQPNMRQRMDRIKNERGRNL